MESKNFNEVLKQREVEEAKRAASESTEMKLDDTQRVKVLSPGRLVFNRFVRNKLAIVGTCILLFMFTFAFLFPVFYKYNQTDIFYKYDYLNVDYASASERTAYSDYVLDPDVEIHYTVQNMITSYINEMDASGETSRQIEDTENGGTYNLRKLGDKVYELSGVSADKAASLSGAVEIATYNSATQDVMYSAGAAEVSGLAGAVKAAIDAGEAGFTHGGKTFIVKKAVKSLYSVMDASSAELVNADGSAPDAEFKAAVLANIAGGQFDYADGKYACMINADNTVTVVRYSDAEAMIVSSLYVFHGYETGAKFDDVFKANALRAINDGGEFEHNGTKYEIVAGGDGDFTVTSGGADIAMLDTYAINRYSGEDSLAIDFKIAARETIEKMLSDNVTTGSFTYMLPTLDANGEYVQDENGELALNETEITVERKEGQFVLKCEQVTYLIDIYAKPSADHLFGTDADGMDILARMMYGGRISLMVGFVVVIIEMLIGVVLGGLAGFFSGWVDTLIMRLVDIFYCIPSMPILIILGSMFDSLKASAYVRLMWMMAVLGFLGWAGVARMVRGQILSLREQEFMTAAEATGLSTSRRIFKHLVPNVMPQLIVSATMGLGSVIITESTLSFLGLGVKHPLATWGTMINSVTSSNENMVRYAYIWIPVGMLICLTVIAFNFVGDGLRDAFDPKMK